MNVALVPSAFNNASFLVFPLELTCEYPMISTLSALTSLNVSNAVFTLVAVATVFVATVFVGLLTATAVMRCSLFLVTLISLVFTPMLTVLLFVESKVVDTFT